MRTQYDIVLCSGAHSKKILLQSTLSLVEVPVTAMLGGVNEASSWNVDRSSTKHSFRRNESVA